MSAMDEMLARHKLERRVLKIEQDEEREDLALGHKEALASLKTRQKAEIKALKDDEE